MSIKYVVVPEKRMVRAYLEGTKYDAYNKICKMVQNSDFCVCPSDRYTMPNRFKVSLICDERDEFNEEFGKKRAKKILLDNYYRSLNKRLGKFREDMIILNGRIFETPEEIG